MFSSIGAVQRLYACSQRVAFHVHASRLLSQSVCAVKESPSGPHAAFEDSRQESIVDGLQDMQVNDDGTAEDGYTSRKRKSGSTAKPAVCSEAISMGLKCFEEGDFEQAVELFTLSLELPGNGAMRLSGSAREYACPSEGEEHAALFNMACCYSRLGELESGLLCVKGLLESGFDDYETLRKDADLESLRACADFEAILGKYDNLAARLLSRKKRKTDQKPGWLARW